MLFKYPALLLTVKSGDLPAGSIQLQVQDAPDTRNTPLPSSAVPTLLRTPPLKPSAVVMRPLGRSRPHLRGALLPTLSIEIASELASAGVPGVTQSDKRGWTGAAGEAGMA